MPGEDSTPPSYTNADATKKLEEAVKIGEWWLIGIGIVTILVNIGIALVYYKQLGEMKKSTDAATKAADAAKKSADLEQYQLRANQGAVLMFRPVILNNQLSVNLDTLPNRAPATNVYLTSTAQRIFLPSHRTIGNVTPTCLMKLPILAKGEGISCSVPGLNQAVYNEMMHTRQSIVLNGTLSYENGFGDRISVPFCRAFLGYELRQYRSDGSNTTAGGDNGGFVECSELDIAVSHAAELRKEYIDIYKPPAPTVAPPPQ